MIRFSSLSFIALLILCCYFISFSNAASPIVTFQTSDTRPNISRTFTVSFPPPLLAVNYLSISITTFNTPFTTPITQQLPIQCTIDIGSGWIISEKSSYSQGLDQTRTDTFQYRRTLQNELGMTCILPNYIGRILSSVNIGSSTDNGETITPTNYSDNFPGLEWSGWDIAYGPMVPVVYLYNPGIWFIKVVAMKVPGWRTDWTFVFNPLIQGPTVDISVLYDTTIILSVDKRDGTHVQVNCNVIESNEPGCPIDGVCITGPIPSDAMTITFELSLNTNSISGSDDWQSIVAPSFGLALIRSVPGKTITNSNIPLLDYNRAFGTTPVITYDSTYLRINTIESINRTDTTTTILYPTIPNQLRYTFTLHGAKQRTSIGPLLNQYASDISFFYCTITSSTNNAATQPQQFLAGDAFIFTIEPNGALNIEFECYGTYAIWMKYRPNPTILTPQDNNIYIHDTWVAHNYRGLVSVLKDNIILPDINNIIDSSPTITIRPQYYGIHDVLGINAAGHYIYITIPGRVLLFSDRLTLRIPNGFLIDNVSQITYTVPSTSVKPTLMVNNASTSVPCRLHSTMLGFELHQCHGTNPATIPPHMYSPTFRIRIRRQFSRSMILNDFTLTTEPIVPTGQSATGPNNPTTISMWIEPYEIKALSQLTTYGTTVLNDDMFEKIDLIHNVTFGVTHVPLFQLPTKTNGYTTTVGDWSIQYTMQLSLPSIPTLPKGVDQSSIDSRLISIYNTNGIYASSQQIIIYPNTEWVVNITMPNGEHIELIDMQLNLESIPIIVRDSFNLLPVSTTAVGYTGFILKYTGIDDFIVTIDIINIITLQFQTSSTYYNNLKIIPNNIQLDFYITTSMTTTDDIGVYPLTIKLSTILHYSNLKFGTIALNRMIVNLPNNISLQDLTVNEIIRIPTITEFDNYTTRIKSTTTPPVLLPTLFQSYTTFNLTITADTTIFPTSQNAQIKLYILLMYYPEIDVNIFSTTPITFWTSDVYTLTATTSILTLDTNALFIPTNFNAKRAFYRIRNIIPNQPYDDTIYFSLYSSTCNILHLQQPLPIQFDSTLPPPSISSTASSTTFIPDCLNDGKCNINGKCECKIGFEGNKCETRIISLCPTNCDQDGIDQSICQVINNNNLMLQSTCPCKDNYYGTLCNEYKELCDINEKICGRNGYPIQSPIDTKCTTECYCNNNWIGVKCSRCGVQCLNGGVPQLTCNNQCFCTNGYNGELCDCRSQTGTILLNGDNEILNTYYSIVIEQKRQPTEILLTLYNNIIQQLLTLSASKLNMDITSIQLKINIEDNNQINDDDNDNVDDSTKVVYATKFTYAFRYNCAQYSESITQEELKSQWSTFTTQFISYELIQELFRFPDNSQPNITITDLESTDGTIPDDYIGIQEPNEVPDMHGLWVGTILMWCITIVYAQWENY